MLPQNFTHKSQEALQFAQHMALERGHQAMETIHLLLALLEQEDGVVPAIIKKLSIDMGRLRGAAEEAMSTLPRMQHGGRMVMLC
jgi:ATP-dependent Clp protease ATP-binding subunit ClpB